MLQQNQTLNQIQLKMNTHPLSNSYTAYYESPIGTIEITSTTQILTSLFFFKAEKRPSPELIISNERPLILQESINQLEQYFKGERINFTIPLLIKGTNFQETVWQELTHIPYGETISYLTLAKRIGNEKAVRAVGLANGSNFISIVIPCHRVIGSNGKLVGYGGDLWRKEWLLKHELQHKPKSPNSLF